MQRPDFSYITPFSPSSRLDLFESEICAVVNCYEWDWAFSLGKNRREEPRPVRKTSSDGVALLLPEFVAPCPDASRAAVPRLTSVEERSNGA